MSERTANPAEAGAAQAGQPWQRLDKRMLLVHPITEVVKFIPVLIGSVILGTSSGNHVWSIIPVVLIVGFALTRWFTTTYRVGPTHVELRTGLLQRKKLSVPRSRIRSVDIEADLLHRVLGLAVLAIGTGQQADSGEQFKLDALDARVVPPLRAALLAHAAGQVDEAEERKVPPENASIGLATTRTPAHEIGHWRPAWVRYAPLSLTGFAIVAPIVGVAFQYGLGEIVFQSDAVHDVEDGGGAALALAGAALLCAIVLLVSAAACAHYLTTYFGLRVSDDGKTLQLRHGLFTTRQITLDLARLRGATVKEPLLLRLAGGAELEAIMTGENPRQKILPQAPRRAVEHTLSHLLAPEKMRDNDIPVLADAIPSGAGASDASPAPGSTPLIAHGSAARRRRHTRALAPVAFLAVAMAYLGLAGAGYSPWWWLLPGLAAPVAIALAEDRYRGLGHAVLSRTATSPTWLITRSGSLDRDRDCLEAPGVIGWTVRRTFFQRRAGVATVVAATAAGKKRYAVVDIPIDEAWELIEAVTPGRLGTR
ncbi:PH domain-containing protein [Nocardia amamiensis]|uniref:PH domain-containing protein n=1 Tax=Nocardia amamiensis TaxID=404578 RepID=A0ABS0D0S2_9NOCA|nr:PH domain-containing protein [Nocardia amamiensis]MBF6300703.1 PH domain-containing protein [Nocardia amamiensis]